jgi:O-antigen/teichoic acid export membrane protein
MTVPASGQPAPPAPHAASPVRIRRDIASAYFASVSRTFSSLVISALVFRFIGRAEFAMLALVRGTIGLLNYTSLGLAPALVHRAARAGRLAVIYSNALAIGAFAAGAGAVVAVVYALTFDEIYRMPRSLTATMPRVALLMGIGVVLRLGGDAPGAMLQVRNRIALDNLLLAGGELLWPLLAGVCLLTTPSRFGLQLVAALYAATGLVVLLSRFRAAHLETILAAPRWRFVQWEIVRGLLGYGLLVVAAQLADYLYAPTDYILIDRLLPHGDIASYAPAVQIDSGLLLLVTGLSAVLLPRAAIAHAGGELKTVRRYYLRGTLASLTLLALASFCVWLFAPRLLVLWLGDPMRGTQSILPLVLIGTTLGGSSAVGRSILLAVGKAKPFAVSVLIAGLVNAMCSYLFVRFGHLGLHGILLGTVVAVVGRCGIWMPLYVLRTLRGGGDQRRPLTSDLPLDH